MGLNERQRRFCEIYAANPNAALSARRAGYSERTARSLGQRLLTNADIQKYIKELQKEAETARIANIQEVRERLTGFLRSDTERTRDRLKAADTLLKSGGAYLAPKEREENWRADISKTPKDDGDDCTEIFLPWSGTQVISAVMRDDGEIVPLQDTGEDVTVFLTSEQVTTLFARYEIQEDEE